MPEVILGGAVLSAGVLGVFALYSLIDTLLPASRQPSGNLVAKGLLFGLAGLSTVGLPIELTDGAIVDARGAVLVGATLFGGWAVGLTSALAMVLLRLGIGGPGAQAGAFGIAVAFAATLVLISPLWGRVRPRRSWPTLLVAALAVAVLEALALLLVPPREHALQLLREAGFARAALQFVAALTLGLLLALWRDRGRTTLRARLGVAGLIFRVSA